MLLYSFCLQGYSERVKLNIPVKIMLLNKTGIIVPRVLNKINKIRNMMEHDFYCPNIDEVQDFADIILLFICYTDKYLLGTKKQCEIEGDSDGTWYRVDFDRENQKIIVGVRGTKNENIELEMVESLKDFFVEFIKNI